MPVSKRELCTEQLIDQDEYRRQLQLCQVDHFVHGVLVTHAVKGKCYTMVTVSVLYRGGGEYTQHVHSHLKQCHDLLFSSHAATMNPLTFVGGRLTIFIKLFKKALRMKEKEEAQAAAKAEQSAAR